MRTHDVVVVGAGLAGLVATAELTRAGRRVLLLDAENAADGMRSVTFTTTVPQRGFPGRVFVIATTVASMTAPSYRLVSGSQSRLRGSTCR